MRIKHFAGYGCINMKKITSSLNYLEVKVWGNHEQGIEVKDYYDVFNWIVKRFDKKHKDYYDIEHIDIDDSYEMMNGCDTEVCVYKIKFRDNI